MDDGSPTRTYASKPVDHAFTQITRQNPGLVPIGGKVSWDSLWESDEFWTRWDNQQPEITNLGWSSFSCPSIDELPSGLIQEAFYQCLPRVGSDVSIINFILELKDCRKLFDFFFTRLSRFRLATGIDLLRGKNRIRDLNLSDLSLVFKRRKGESFVQHLKRLGSSLVDETASNYLNFSFGWAPLISDIKSIWHALTTLKRRLEWLERNQGKLLYRRYRKDLSGDFDAPQPFKVEQTPLECYWYCPTIWQPDNFVLSRKFSVESTVRWLTAPTLRASMLYRYSIPEASARARQIAAYMDVFGFKPDATILWNAIPFSFIADWFLDIGSFLRRNFSSENFKVKTEVLDFSYSLKSVIIAERRFILPAETTGGGYSFPAVPPQVVRSVLKSRYQRRTGIPGMSASTLSRFSDRELLLGGALAITLSQNKRRRPRSVGIVEG